MGFQSDPNQNAAVNQNPEQIARARIDAMLTASGWTVQSFRQKNIAASQARGGPLFEVMQPRREEEGARLPRNSGDFCWVCFILHPDGYAVHRSCFYLSLRILALPLLVVMNHIFNP
jgi:hypothetical protein